MKNNPLTDIYIANDLIVSGSTSDQTTLTCGLSISGITLENASNLYYANFESALRCLLLALSSSDLTLQFVCANSGEFPELLDYYKTSQNGCNEWDKQQRNARFARIDELIQTNLIRRKEVHLFISRQLPKKSTNKMTSDAMDTYLQAEAKPFDVAIQQIKHSFQLIGGQAERLTGEELFICFDKALNPSMRAYDKERALKRFNPENSISENCLNSDMMPIEKADCGFHFDGNHYAVLSLRTLPHISTAGVITQLSNLPISDYRLNVITQPLSLEEEIEKQEKQIAQLQKALATSNQTRLATPLQNCIDRLNRLSCGNIAPYQIQLTITCWDEDPIVLQEKLGLLKSAILRFQGAQYYCHSNPVFARNFYLSNLPGAPVNEEAFTHETEDVTVSHLLPLGSADASSLVNAEAIYETDQGGIFGLSVFTDEKKAPFIRHGLITGKTGFGKSASTIDFITQLQAVTDHIFIIEDGGSYLGYVSTFGADANSLIVDKNGNSTLNYLDTNGLALSAQHLSDTALFLKLMITEEERSQVSKSTLKQLLSKFYLSFAARWSDAHPQRSQQSVLEYRTAKLHFSNDPDKNPRALVSTQFDDYLHWTATSEKEYARTKAETIDLEIETNRTDLLKFCYGFMTTEEMPTHSDFHDWLTEQILTPDNEEERILRNLADWRADEGDNGCLFDGISTFSFNSPIVHIELGRISSQDQEMKNMASFLITNSIRNTITRMDRSKRKLIVFEELGSFLDIEGGDKIVADFYQRGRRYNCPVISIIQEITAIPEKLRNSILSNSSFALLFRQQDARNAEELQRAFRLPDATKDSLSTLPKPTKENGAAFIAWQSGDDAPIIHSARNIVTPEMLYIVASDGKSHELRQKALKQHDNVIEGISIESLKVS